jgi:translation initiation factor IF-2
MLQVYPRSYTGLCKVNNKSIAKAEPSQPVKIVGLKTLPRAGDPIICVKSEEIAKELMNRRQAHLASSNQITSYRADASKAKMDVIVTGGASKKGYMANNVLKKFGLDEESVASEEEEEEEEEIRIPVVLKADADGTLAALRDTLLAIQHESKLNLCIDPIEMSIGHVTPNDVTLASESGAVIFCFNLKGSKDKTAMSLALANKVEIRSHNVIYHLLDEAKNVFSSYCPPIPVEKIHGKAIVQAVFNINNNRNAERVAGLMVNEGKLYLDKFNSDSTTLDCEYRVKRGNEVIADGLKAKSLRRVKEEVKDVRRGEECGLNLLNHTDFEEGDVIECYSVELKRTFV